MSLQIDRNRVNQIRKQIAELNKKAADENARCSKKSGEINRLSLSMGSVSSISALKSKQNQIESKQRELASLEKRAADWQKKVASKESELHRAQTSLERTEAAESKKRIKEQDKQHRKSLDNAKAVTRELNKQSGIQRNLLESKALLQTLPDSITVLFVASNPTDQSALRLDEEMRLVTKKIRESKYRDSVDLRAMWATRPDDLLQGLNEHLPTVVHFSGHGTDSDELVLQDDAGNAKLVPRSSIVQLFKVMASDIRLVVFNTCFSEAQAQEIASIVPAAIGMNDSIGDEAARVFSAQLYSSIGFGLTIEAAFEQAKVALILAGISEDQTPTLHLMDNLDGKDMILVNPKSGAT